MQNTWRLVFSLMISYGAWAKQQPVNAPQVTAHVDSAKHTEDLEGTGGSEYWPAVFGFRFKVTDSLLVVFTGTLAYFTYRLDRSTRKLWRSGELQLKLAREEFTTTSRAFVFLETIVPTISLLSDSPHGQNPTNKRPELFVTYLALQAKWQNAGNTPTKNMKVRFNRRFFDNGMPPDFDFASALPDLGERNFFLGPRAIDGGEVITTNPMQANAVINDGQLVAEGDPSIFVFGRADYEDIFGDPHFVEWCYKMRFEQPASEKGIERLRATFIQYGSYNRTDYDG